VVIGHLLQDVATESLRFRILILRLQPVSEGYRITERQRESGETIVGVDYTFVVRIQLQFVKKELRLDVSSLLKFL